MMSSRDSALSAAVELDERMSLYVSQVAEFHAERRNAAAEAVAQAAAAAAAAPPKSKCSRPKRNIREQNLPELRSGTASPRKLNLERPNTNHSTSRCAPLVPAKEQSAGWDIGSFYDNSDGGVFQPSRIDKRGESLRLQFGKRSASQTPSMDTLRVDSRSSQTARLPHIFSQDLDIYYPFPPATAVDAALSSYQPPPFLLQEEMMQLSHIDQQWEEHAPATRQQTARPAWRADFWKSATVKQALVSLPRNPTARTQRRSAPMVAGSNIVKQNGVLTNFLTGRRIGSGRGYRGANLIKVLNAPTAFRTVVEVNEWHRKAKSLNKYKQNSNVATRCRIQKVGGSVFDRLSTGKLVTPPWQTKKPAKKVVVETVETSGQPVSQPLLADFGWRGRGYKLSPKLTKSDPDFQSASDARPPQASARADTPTEADMCPATMGEPHNFENGSCTRCKILETQKSDAAAPKQESAPANKPVVALHDYAGEHEDDLSFKAGAVITVTSSVDPERWVGTVGGKSGRFPAAFVNREPKVRALQDYSGEKAEDLTFKAGQTIELSLASESDEWWHGTLDGKTGRFPKKLVTILTDA
mmetsp:Transcript_26709/g.52638  ORF Transcript_26709/g.52638 Transcript_26709/m.52638 type:complete len:583 (+) Transcript_26709:3-1751(+)